MEGTMDLEIEASDIFNRISVVEPVEQAYHALGRPVHTITCRPYQIVILDVVNESLSQKRPKHCWVGPAQAHRTSCPLIAWVGNLGSHELSL